MGWIFVTLAFVALAGLSLLSAPEGPLKPGGPLPAFDLLPMERYGHVIMGPRSVLLEGSRGCPYKCTFCLWPQTSLDGKFRPRSGEAIVDEVEFLLEHYPRTKSFFFDDDTFNLGRRRVG